MSTRILVTALVLSLLTTGILSKTTEQAEPQAVPGTTSGNAPAQALNQAEVVQEPEYNNEFHYLDPSTGKLTPLEKVALEISTKVRALGFGGAKQTLQAANPGSSFRLKTNAPLTFVVRGLPPGMNPEDWITLTRFTAKKDHRELLMASAGFGGMGGKTRGTDEGKIPFTVAKYGTNSVKIAPSQPLEPGEYVITTNVFGRGFCFGIDPAQPEQK